MTTETTNAKPDPRSATPITVNTLRRELNLERWDRSRVPVKARAEDGSEYGVIGIFNDRDALVLQIDGSYTVEPS